MLLVLWVKLGYWNLNCFLKWHFAPISGLGAIHNVGVVHRDIKLKNVMISGTGNLLICDFGLAKWLGRKQKTGTICGTLSYMAPEVARGENYGHSVDFWSLGVLLYDLAFLTHPFPKATDHEAMSSLLEQQKVCDLLTHSDSKLNHLLESLLCYDPLEREVARVAIEDAYRILYTPDQLLTMQDDGVSFLQTL